MGESGGIRAQGETLAFEEPRFCVTRAKRGGREQAHRCRTGGQAGRILCV